MDSLVRVFELHQAVADLVIQQANFAGGLFDRGVLKAFGELCKRYVKLLRNVRAARLLKSLELAPKDAEEAARGILARAVHAVSWRSRFRWFR